MVQLQCGAARDQITGPTLQTAWFFIRSIPYSPPYAGCVQMFPRHILEHMMAAAEQEPGGTPVSVDHLAHSHQNVTIMFMDIVGECMDDRGEGRRGVEGDG